MVMIKREGLFPFRFFMSPLQAISVPQPPPDTERPSEPEFLLVCNNARLRAAIRSNVVTFPSQMVRLPGRGDADQTERIVQLYFIRGWPVWRICDRYRISKIRVQATLTSWRRRAVAAGFIQEIQPRNQPRVPSASSSIPSPRPV